MQYVLPTSPERTARPPARRNAFCRPHAEDEDDQESRAKGDLGWLLRAGSWQPRLRQRSASPETRGNSASYLPLNMTIQNVPLSL
jgi:hypothetical protein